jgi:hypothetical protein
LPFRVQADLPDGSKAFAERGSECGTLLPHPNQVVVQGLLPWCFVTVPLAAGIEVDNVPIRPDVVHIPLDILGDPEGALFEECFLFWRSLVSFR